MSRQLPHPRVSDDQESITKDFTLLHSTFAFLSSDFRICLKSAYVSPPWLRHNSWLNLLPFLLSWNLLSTNHSAWAFRDLSYVMEALCLRFWRSLPPPFFVFLLLKVRAELCYVATQLGSISSVVPVLFRFNFFLTPSPAQMIFLFIRHIKNSHLGIFALDVPLYGKLSPRYSL